MKKRVNMNDIAEALNLSRNTVSKAFNNQNLPEKTRQLILNKAIEMGYKNLDAVSKRETVLHNKNIMILTTNDLQNLNYFLSVLRGIESIVSKYTLNLTQFQYNDLSKFNELKEYISDQSISGILILEAFNEDLVKSILKLNIPVVFLDSTVNCINYKGNYDIVLMENMHTLKKMVKGIIASNRLKTAGFVGDYTHCLSFYERYTGFKEALFDSKIPYTSKYNITLPDSFPYGDIELLAKELKKLEALPDMFVCANDFLAISLIKALQSINKRVPHDIQVIGFDNTFDARNFNPALTTIDTDKEVLGNESIIALLNRIKYQENRNKIIYLKTNPIYRESTK